MIGNYIISSSINLSIQILKILMTYNLLLYFFHYFNLKFIAIFIGLMFKNRDEDAPSEIPDNDAKKPEGWLDDEPTTIPDPEAKKPEDWDDEEDGDWIAPSIPNPKCEEAPGCGEWKHPMKSNPNYKGKWYPPEIDNPAYKGPWAPRKIPNPDYFEDLHPSNFEKIVRLSFI